MVAAALILLCSRPLEVALSGEVPWLFTVPATSIIGREVMHIFLLPFTCNSFISITNNKIIFCVAFAHWSLMIHFRMFFGVCCKSLWIGVCEELNGSLFLLWLWIMSIIFNHRQLHRWIIDFVIYFILLCFLTPSTPTCQ